MIRDVTSHFSSFYTPSVYSVPPLVSLCFKKSDTLSSHFSSLKTLSALLCGLSVSALKKTTHNVTSHHSCFNTLFNVAQIVLNSNYITEN